jgi:Zn-finger nucleic acid-binding protein
MKCPICESSLTPVEYEGVEVDVCETCGGEFLDADELGHVIRVREEVFPDDVREVLSLREPVFGVPIDERRRRLSCPKCGDEMETINYSTDSGVYVDRCEGCGGFWLDADELEHVQILSEHWADEAPEVARQMAGRLEQARMQAAERTNGAFAGSRFAFVNALINRILDAA